MKYLNAAFIIQNKKVIKLHLLYWTLFISFDFLFGLIGLKKPMNKMQYLANSLFLMGYFYTQIFILYETLIKDGFTISFFIKLFIVYVSTIVIKSISDHVFKNNMDRLYQMDYFVYEVYRFTYFSFFLIAYLVFMKSFEDARNKEQIEKKLLQTEIAFLKAQINPHFLFNTLNFVFEKVFDVSPKAANIVLKLSDMMRYSVTSSKLDLVHVKKELEAIDDYFEIQKARFNNDLYINFNVEPEVDNYKIPPLILLSLIENSFKHGVANDPNRPIQIHLTTNQNILVFTCKNAVRNDFKDKATTAVGLENIERRLQVVYENKYELIQTKQNDCFTVILKIFY